MKLFVFAIDDGTIFDEKVIAIFNKYGISATFNLNSGLQNYVWYKDWLEVRRLKFDEHKDIYNGHEVASHSLTHPFLTSLSDDDVRREVKKDIDNLTNIFHREIKTFSFVRWKIKNFPIRVTFKNVSFSKPATNLSM